MKNRLILATALLVAAANGPLRAADHRDGPAVLTDPAADINDVLAWMTPDETRVNLVMTVFPGAGTGARFSDQVQYVFHTTSKPAFLDSTRLDTEVICEFSGGTMVSCWVGDDEFVAGEATATGGIASRSGRLRVFAGLRDDPFFFNASGFGATTAAVAAAASGLAFDPAGCPTLDAATSTALVTQLRTEPDGSKAVDDFGGGNVLALVVQVDKELLTRGGPILGVWGATYRK